MGPPVIARKQGQAIHSAEPGAPESSLRPPRGYKAAKNRPVTRRRDRSTSCSPQSIGEEGVADGPHLAVLASSCRADKTPRPRARSAAVRYGSVVWVPRGSGWQGGELCGGLGVAVRGRRPRGRTVRQVERRPRDAASARSVSARSPASVAAALMRVMRRCVGRRVWDTNGRSFIGVGLGTRPGRAAREGGDLPGRGPVGPGGAAERGSRRPQLVPGGAGRTRRTRGFVRGAPAERRMRHGAARNCLSGLSMRSSCS